MGHSFHIPVLGLAFTIDTPLKVAKYGISSVLSIVDDELIERMRKYYAQTYQQPYIAISDKEDDARARRITAYLNLVSDIVEDQVAALRLAPFEAEGELASYFNLLPDEHSDKRLFQQRLICEDEELNRVLESTLRQSIQPGDIDVNIMSKVDKINYDSQGTMLNEKYTDAVAAIRGFANSKLKSSVILSAGMNPRLYAFLTEIEAFLPHSNGTFDKKITLKVSDYRSALIQAKFLAKKGIWVSEFRIESGLNCGGHAFATEGFLMGPILEEFKNKKNSLPGELFPLYQQALQGRGRTIEHAPTITYTVQGGIGTAYEQRLLLDHYGFDRTGWGSPFLLVPEATTVDDQTLTDLADAQADDFYISGASPLGVPFNNFRKSSAEQQRRARIAQGRPGSPCRKKYLVSSTAYSQEPICTASRLYQHHKIQELDAAALSAEAYQQHYQEITEKTCLCEGLAASAYLKYDILEAKENTAVAICPGPNTAFFTRSYSLREMVDHIYGREDLLAGVERPFFFINELHLYLKHIATYIEHNMFEVNDKKEKYVEKFKNQLLEGILYYQNLKDNLSSMSRPLKLRFEEQLQQAKAQLQTITFSKQDL